MCANVCITAVLQIEKDFIMMGRREVMAHGARMGHIKGKDKERGPRETACSWWEGLCAHKGRGHCVFNW